MTGQQIINEARRMLDDETIPYKWKNEELVNHLNTALDDISRATDSVRDDSTSAIVDITLVEDRQDYSLDSSVLEVKSARVSGETGFLDKFTAEEMDKYHRTWRTDTGRDTPTKFVLDYLADIICFYPIPGSDIAGTDVNLVVVRTEGTPFTTENLSNSPETPARYHNEIPFGILRRAYLKAGETTFNAERAKTFYELFEITIQKVQRDYLRLKAKKRPVVAPHKGNM